MSATQTYSTEAQLLQNTPKEFPNAIYAAGRLKRSRNTITMASQEAASTITCLPIPAGSVFAFGIINASATLGSTTLQIGFVTYPATDPDRLRADATFTAATATLFGDAAALAVDDEPSTQAMTPVITVGTATMPSSGTLVVDFYYSQAS